MRKNLHDKILKGEPNEQHLSTIPKSFFFFTNPQKQLPKKKKKGLSHKSKNVLFKKKQKKDFEIFININQLPGTEPDFRLRGGKTYAKKILNL